MTTKRWLGTLTTTWLVWAAGCGPAVETNETEGEDLPNSSFYPEPTTAMTEPTGGGCEGPPPSCPSGCFDDSDLAYCEFGQWECASPAFPPGQEPRCSPPDTFGSSDGSGGGSSDGSTGGPAEVGAVDVLVVVDNSAGTAGLQRSLAESAVGFLDELEIAGVTDAHVMVTSTDVGNISCAAFEPEGYDPLGGAPTSTPCLERLDWFDDAPGGGSDACLEVCSQGDTIDGPFLSLHEGGQSNATGDPADALACLIPQGVRGCGFESPMEAMLQSLNPGACWNVPGGCSGKDEAFLREEASLVIVVLTDEGDCSVADPGAMQSSTYHAINPETGQPGLSSAWCFNAGMDCEGPGCVIREDSPLHPVDRYAGFLAGLRAAGKQINVVMLAGLEDGSDPRDWTTDDLFADEIDGGATLETRAFQFGPAPSCKDEDRRVRALPTPRMQAALCGDEPCHRASACDDGYDAVLAEVAGAL